MATTHSNLGMVLSLADDHEQAIEQLERAVGLLQASPGADPRDLRVTLAALGDAHARADQPRDALRTLQQARDLLPRDAQDRERADLLWALAQAHAALDPADPRAKEHAKRALGIYALFSDEVDEDLVDQVTALAGVDDG